MKIYAGKKVTRKLKLKGANFILFVDKRALVASALPRHDLGKIFLVRVVSNRRTGERERERERENKRHCIGVCPIGDVAHND